MHSISTFARLTGLTTSALRFYGDCGVLTPAHVEPTTGYRYYEEAQVEHAVLVRKLRTAGMPLAEVTTVLDGDDADARRVLAEHARRLRSESVVAQAALREVLRSLPGSGHTEARLGGPELAAAVRQVVPAASDHEIPALGCVLVELTGEQLRLVASDRYRLAVRELTPYGVDGDARSVLVPAAELAEAATRAARHAELAIATRPGAVTLTAGGEQRTLPVFDGEFPDYRQVLAGLAEPAHRVLVGRAALGQALAECERPAVLRTGHDTLAVGEVSLPALCTAGARIAFDPAVLRPALDASVGPDVLLEIAGALSPVVVRSADQGSFTTLVMPVPPPESTED